MQLRSSVTVTVLAMVLLLGACDTDPGFYTPMFTTAVIERVDLDPPRPKITVEDRHLVAVLAMSFDEREILNEKPTDSAGSWEAKYEVLFTHEDGRQFKVVTSHDDKLWSSGKGDKPLLWFFPGVVDWLFDTDGGG